MKDKPTLDELRELGWRRQLTGAERQRVAGRPEARAELAREARLTEALAQLPAAPVSSNFTARVMQAIDREEARSRSWSWSWTRWLPRVAVTTAALAVGVVTWEQHEVTERRTALAQSVVQVAASTAVPGVDALKNFDAILRMGQAQPADDKLLALMQ